MRCAIIGSGIIGLATAYLLRNLCPVTVYSDGEGATAAASGLLNPYMGAKRRKAPQADAGLAAALALLEEVCPEAILPYPLVRDEEVVPGGRLIDLPAYLAALKKPLSIVPRTIHHLDVLTEEMVIVAAGAGSFSIGGVPSLPHNLVKGQSLICDGTADRALLSRHHLVPYQGKVLLGATYEHQPFTEEPDLRTAVELLQPELPVVGCLSGVRVSPPDKVTPIHHTISPGRWLLTGFGSRALLLHALYAQQQVALCEQFLFG